jgi:Flp pilus assembly protein TadG
MDAMRNFVRRIWANEQGAELIEFAVALPILLMVTAGIVDFGFLMQRREVVANAAREGARVGLLPDFGIDDVTDRVNTYLAASGLDAVAPQVNYGSIELSPGGPTIDVVQVIVEYPHQFIFLSPMALLAGGDAKADITLRAGSTMRREVAAAAP